MGLRKSFPKDRNYEFWNIMMCSLIQRDGTQADKDRNLFGTLAFRMISKAADTISTDQVCECAYCIVLEFYQSLLY
jgi:N-terminal acetyltransferase B complex non-catalytic subunit